MWVFVDYEGEDVVGAWWNPGVQEWKWSILAWFFHGKLYLWVLGVDEL